MPLYELRTYTLRVGTMAEAVKLYQEIGFPALQKGKHDKKLVGYFQADTGTINQLLHLWKFEDDGDRRARWTAVYANKDFVEGFASKFRPLLMTQEVKLLQAAPWGPHPWLPATGGSTRPLPTTVSRRHPPDALRTWPGRRP
jgi:NIPSNAP